MTQFHHNHQLKRLQHTIKSDLHSSLHDHHVQHTNISRTNASDYHLPLPNDESMRESIQNFSIPASNDTKQSRPFKPGPHRARRGIGGGRPRDRSWYSSISLPKRAINYDLAESFMDHSTNPLSSDLYKIRFKHSTKQWPNGRFINYKEKLDTSNGNIIDIICTRTFPIVQKRKKMEETQQHALSTISSVVLADAIAQEQKKKQADKQTNVYANLFGCGKIPRLSSNAQIKKTNCIVDSTASSTSISLLAENKEDHQC